MALSKVSRIVFWGLLIGILAVGVFFFYRYLTQNPHAFYPTFRDAVASGVFNQDGSHPGIPLSCVPPSARDIHVQWKPDSKESWAAYGFPSGEKDAILGPFGGRIANDPPFPDPKYSSSWWLPDGAWEAANQSGSVFQTDSGEVLVLLEGESKAFYYRPRGNP
jgi:hypothetical protein